VLVPDHFDAARAATLVEQNSVTHLNGSDDMLLAVLDHGRDLTSWRQGVHAEFTGHGEEAVVRAEAVGARITGVYGSSETFALLARWSPNDPSSARARNGGVPVDRAVEVRAVDTATGALLAPDQLGELQLRGPSVLNAYLFEDGASPPPLTTEGWFPTGDLGTVDGKGGFVYLARLGDALRLAGFLTDPAEIEQQLLDHPAVTGAQVVGAPKPGGGDVAVAFIVATDRIDEAIMLDHCRRGLANYKVPARIVMVDAFPTIDGANGVKVRKAELRAQAAALIS
jgi:fatty-acyl-CoA synthase